MKTKTLVYIAAMAALTAVGSFIKIPTPISAFTLQFFFTAMAAQILGAKGALASQLVYLALGLAGLPIFAGGGGADYIFKPTFGFLLGLLPASYIMGRIREKCNRKYAIAGCLAGLAALYAVGLPYMHLILNLYLGIEQSLWHTIVYGMLIFLPADLLKCGAAVYLGGKVANVAKRT